MNMRAKIWILDDTAKLPGWWKMTCLMDDDKVDGRWPKNEREQRWVEDDQKSKENKRMFSLFSFWWKTWPIENDLGSGTWHENGKQPEIKTKNLKLVFKNLKQWQPQGRLVPVIRTIENMRNGCCKSLCRKTSAGSVVCTTVLLSKT